MLLWSLSLHFMASVPCTVGLISTAWVSREAVGMEHVPLGGSLRAVKEFVTHLRRQDIFFNLSVCHKSSCPGMLSCYYSLCQKGDVGLIRMASWRDTERSLVGFWKAQKCRGCCSCTAIPFLLGDDVPFFAGDDLILPCEVFFTFLKDSRTEVWWTIDGRNTDDITDPKIKVTQR